jgi:hypothetical protein
MNREFIEAYPTTDNRTLAARFGKSPVTILKWARRLGLKKAPEYRAEVQRQNATGCVKSQETRKRIAAKARGRKLSAETKAKILQTKRQRGTLAKGENHYKWKGGKPWQRFKDPRYLAWRNAVLERDGYVCQHCQRQCKKYERGLAAHHIREYASYSELRYEAANGITLCRNCHLTLHGKPAKPKAPVPCACGCGTLIAPFDCYGRPRCFVNHHHGKGKSFPESAKQALREQRRGKPLAPEHRAKIAAGLRNSSKRVGRPLKIIQLPQPSSSPFD